jgi:diacylglycerol kinase family enzyme
MLVHPLRQTELRVLPQTEVQPQPRVAVLLNANARKVNERVVRALSHVVPEEDLFISHDLHGCRAIAREVVERRYEIVFTGGGDGTFVGFLNEIYRELDARGGQLRQRAPKFGVLKLGTGNGLATLLNASSLRGDGILDDVLRARAGELPAFRALDLLHVNGKRTHFAGLGADGKLLNDYMWVKQNLGRGVLKAMLSGPGGYVASIALRTAPHFISAAAQLECEVFNGQSGPAYRLRPDGAVMAEHAPGELLFRGHLAMCAAGTIPYYGFALKMFPFATRRRGMMHLRLASDVTSLKAIANLPRLWNGSWFCKGLRDFHAREFMVRFARPAPLQIGGDAEGYLDKVTMRVADEPIEVVDFAGAMN